MSRQRLLIGAINREVLLAQSMMRKLVMYFSMVRRSAACASRESVSASLMMTTVSKIYHKSWTAEELRTTFESLLRTHVDLLSLRNFFEDFLNHYSVIISDFTARGNY